MNFTYDKFENSATDAERFSKTYKFYDKPLYLSRHGTEFVITDVIPDEGTIHSIALNGMLFTK